MLVIFRGSRFGPRHCWNWRLDSVHISSVSMSIGFITKLLYSAFKGTRHIKHRIICVMCFLSNFVIVSNVTQSPLKRLIQGATVSYFSLNLRRSFDRCVESPVLDLFSLNSNVIYNLASSSDFYTFIQIRWCILCE